MKKYLALLSLVVNALCFSQQYYYYHGVGYQKLEGTTDYWEITVHPTVNEDLFISYPDIPCSSEWIFVREDKGGKIYKEKLVSGFDKCIDNGIVLLMDDETSITSKRFYIYQDEQSTQPYALGFIDEIIAQIPKDLLPPKIK